MPVSHVVKFPHRIRIVPSSVTAYLCHTSLIMKVLLFGSKGWLAQELLKVYPDAICASSDIADASAVSAELDEHRPDVVINCAGKTGRPNVDWCEDHKEETVRSNVLGPLVLLEECAKRNTYWVHVGSGCIYQGDKGGEGFDEEDEPNFTGSFYSKSKLWSDAVLREFPVLNLRLRMPFDGTENPRSLITKISKYDRVLDSQNSVTYIPDFLKAVEALIAKRATGTYNVVNPGTTSPFAIMTLYKEMVDPTKEFEKLSVEDLPQVAKAGRSNCKLSCKKLQSEGIEMLPTEDAIREALEHIRASKSS